MTKPATNDQVERWVKHREPLACIWGDQHRAAESLVARIRHEEQRAQDAEARAKVLREAFSLAVAALRWIEERDHEFTAAEYAGGFFGSPIAQAALLSTEHDDQVDE